jgi:outer membrane protein insertion porin family
LPDSSNGKSTNISLKIGLSQKLCRSESNLPNQWFERFYAEWSVYTALFINGLSHPERENQYKLPEFHKWRFSGEWYTPIGRARGAEKNKQFILKAAAKYGFIGKYNQKLEVSPFERFQVGDAGFEQYTGIIGIRYHSSQWIPGLQQF